jgi:hypothetical protein
MLKIDYKSKPDQLTESEKWSFKGSSISNESSIVRQI